MWFGTIMQIGLFMVICLKMSELGEINLLPDVMDQPINNEIRTTNRLETFIYCALSPELGTVSLCGQPKVSNYRCLQGFTFTFPRMQLRHF